MSEARALVIYDADTCAVRTVDDWESLDVGSMLVTEDDPLPWLIESMGLAEGEGGVSRYQGEDYTVWYRVRAPHGNG